MAKARTPLLILMVAAAISIAAGSLTPSQAPAPAGSPAPARARSERIPPPSLGIEPEADRLLRAMATYLGSLQSFTVVSNATDEVVLASGQKIQHATEYLMVLQRPNRLHSEQVGAFGGPAFWYDGKQMTLACKASGSYATVPAPANIDATIDRVRKQFRLEAPGTDLLYSRPYEVLTEQVTGGRFVGRETVDSVATNHLAFEGEAVDWQIWIQEGSQPLPLRFVVTSKGIKGEPQLTVQLSRWEPGIKVPPTTFGYEAPATARRLESFPVDCVVPGASGPAAPPSYAGVAPRSVRRAYR